MSDSPLILPAAHFAGDPELRRPVDIRRWKSGERNTRRGPSPIQGWGSFAIRRIRRGAAVLVREPLTGNFPVNHSERPNTARARNRSGLFALRDIEAGEEITEDYRYLPYFGQGIPVLPVTLQQASLEEYAQLLGRAGMLVNPDPLSSAPAAGEPSHLWTPPLCDPR